MVGTRRRSRRCQRRPPVSRGAQAGLRRISSQDEPLASTRGGSTTLRIRRGGVTGAEYDSLLDLADELSNEDLASESSAIFFNLFGGICSMEKRCVLSTKNRIGAEIAASAA